MGEKILEKNNINRTDISNYPSGVYSLVLKDHINISHQKIIKE